MRFIYIYLFLLFGAIGFSQELLSFEVDSYKADQVQPMTGIVFWTGDHTDTEAISLEYSYMLYKDVTDQNGDFDWSVVENKLNAVASRGHQAILRFRYTYVGYQTAVPQYIKDLPDYHETLGVSEGEDTWFPDWSHSELRDYTIRFYQAFAQKYDGDPRLAFLETGFGLWAEYHIYDGPFELGKTFPSKEFQSAFLMHMDTIFQVTPWMISIDAADSKYAPFEDNQELLNLQFGNFDDSFMAEEHPQVNAYNWAFFAGNDRYKYNPAGGEFSYYTDWDQMHVLDLPDGAHGISYEESAKNFQITFMIGNDQPDYQSIDRIKQASIASGYKFQIQSVQANEDSTFVKVKNVGIASFYYPAFVSINGVRSSKSLRFLSPGESMICPVGTGIIDGSSPEVKIECDYLPQGVEIGYYGTLFSKVNTLTEDINIRMPSLIFSNHLNIDCADHLVELDVLTIDGKILKHYILQKGANFLSLPQSYSKILFFRFSKGGNVMTKKLFLGDH